jgi:hypothetical protein
LVQAYAEACRHAEPAEILAGAQAWAAAFHEPRFLPNLAKWLAGRSWAKPPPQKRERRPRKRSHAEVMLALARGDE